MNYCALFDDESKNIEEEIIFLLHKLMKIMKLQKNSK